MAYYSIWLSTPAGVRLRLIDRYLKLRYRLSCNTVGVAVVDLDPAFPMKFLQEDSIIEIWRQVPGEKKYLDGDAVWFIRDWEEGLNDRGQQTNSFIAYSGLDLIDRRIIAYPADTAYTSKTALIDNMMKAIVRENLGSLATDAARRVTQLLIDNDTSGGPSTTKGFSWRKALPTLRELAQESQDLGSPVFLDVINNLQVALGFIFRTYLGQRGINRSSSSSSPVILSTRNGTLSSIRRSYITSGERNYVYVGGKQQASSRVIVQDSLAERLTVSPFNRREIFADARSTADGSLAAEGRATLRANRPRETWSIKIRDGALQYGRDYGFGDRVIVENDTWSVDARLDSVEISVEQGREDIESEVVVDG